MDSLRWALLLVGLVILFVIYLLGRKKNRLSGQITDSDTHDRYAPENLDIKVFDKKMFDQIDFNALASGMSLDADDVDTDKLTNGAAVKPAAEVPVETASRKSDDRLIVFYLVSKDQSLMKGKQVVEALEKAGLRYGEMKVFHFHDTESNKPVFSVANLTDPGYFDLITIDTLETPGLSLFMQLPESASTVVVFDHFVSVIEQLKQTLSAVLKDRKHNTVSPQILSHMRENMLEYERKQKIKRKMD